MNQDEDPDRADLVFEFSTIALVMIILAFIGKLIYDATR